MSDTNFQWTDDLILEFARFTYTCSPTFQGRYADLEQFKESKKPKQKEWEIIAYWSGKTAEIFYKPEEGNSKRWSLRGKCGYIIIPDHLSIGGIEIYSVKRLSDNEVFTIGDRVVSTVNINHPFTITCFTIANADFIYADSCPYDNLKHSPKSLFTTTDGVEIKERDIYWFVKNGFGTIFHGTSYEDSGKISDAKYFSTKEAAEKYVYNNKPIYSRNDLKIITTEFQRLLDSKTPE